MRIHRGGARELSDDAVVAAAARALGRRVERVSRVGGGDINDAWALELEGGGRAFLKSRADAPADEYGAEAAGLAWLGNAGGLRVPGVLAVIEEGDLRGLVLDWVDRGRLSEAGEEELGRGLALTHAAGADGFNALPPDSPRKILRFGGVEVPISPAEDAGWLQPTDSSSVSANEQGSEASAPTWPQVLAARLERLSQVALDSGRISGACARRVGSVVERLDALAGPAEPPARIHGDLWSGNVHAGADGRPWLIDPAAHGAHREMDLAMLELFGTVSARTLAAYEEVRPLAEGWEGRIGLWQLQPLLVHAILFGGSYGSAVERTALRYW